MQEYNYTSFIADRHKRKRLGKKTGIRLPYNNTRIPLDEVAKLAGCAKSTAYKYCISQNMTVESLIERIKRNRK